MNHWEILDIKNYSKVEDFSTTHPISLMGELVQWVPLPITLDLYDLLGFNGQ